jgi:hypothetical protein
MTEEEWIASNDPAAMLAHLQHGTGSERPWDHWGRTSDRKLRLFAWHIHNEACRLRGAANRYGEDGLTVTHWSTGHSYTQYQIQRTALHGSGPFAWLEPLMSNVYGANLLHDIAGNPWRIARLMGKWRAELYQPWLTSTVLAVARNVYDERRFEDMPVLADALEEAGCTDESLVQHCRGLVSCLTCKGTGKRDATVDAGYGNPLMTREGWEWCYVCNSGGHGVTPGWRSPRGPLIHVRGCWALDLILGKE